MTVCEFDAPASSTRPASSRKDYGRRPIIRVAWLLARSIRGEPLGYEHYERRFGRSPYAFQSDLAALRRASIYRAGKRLGS
jgi:hypothetical protein